jgi:hypothetical protein
MITFCCLLVCSFLALPLALPLFHTVCLFNTEKVGRCSLSIVVIVHFFFYRMTEQQHTAHSFFYRKKVLQKKLSKMSPRKRAEGGTLLYFFRLNNARQYRISKCVNLLRCQVILKRNINNRIVRLCPELVDHFLV